MAAEMLKTLYSTKKHVDVTLRVKGDERKLKAHRLILMTASEYFEILFTSNFLEKNSESVTLTMMSFETLEIIVKVIYGHELQLSKSASIGDVIIAADYLMVDCVLSILDEYIVKNLNCANALDIYRVEDKISGKTKEQLHEFMAKNIQNLKGVRNLDNKTFNQFFCTIPMDSKTALILIKDWVWVDLEAREKFVFQLLSAVVFTTTIDLPFIMTNILPMCRSAEPLKFVIALMAQMSNYSDKFVKKYLPQQKCPDKLMSCKHIFNISTSVGGGRTFSMCKKCNQLVIS